MVNLIYINLYDMKKYELNSNVFVLKLFYMKFKIFFNF